MVRKELLVILPAHNEAKNLPALLDRMEAQGVAQMADVLVINDASEDETGQIIAARGYACITNVFNLGYGGAIQVGYKYAVQHGYRYLIQMDADGQHDPVNLPVIYERLRGYPAGGGCPDIVLGTRYWKGGDLTLLSPAKRLAHKMFCVLIRLMTGQVLTDPTSGLQGLSRAAFSLYALYDHFDVRYPDANMLMQMLLLDYSVVEVPVVMHPRTAGKSIHSGLRPVWYMIRMLFSTLAVAFRIRVLKLCENHRQR